MGAAASANQQVHDSKGPSQSHQQIHGSVPNASVPQTPVISNVHDNIFKAFPKWIKAPEFVKLSYSLLNPHGFNNINTLPCASLCRDELTANFMDLIDEGSCKM